LTATKYRLKKFEVLDSTNAQARRMAEEGEGGPLWIVAQSQSNGRGRQGRDWVSKPGNVFATLLLSVPVSTRIATQVSFVTALAIHQTCRSHLPASATLGLKWPNDVLLEQKKLAGILIETISGDGHESLVLAIGCGINLQHAPQDTPYGATCLNDHLSKSLSPQEFLDGLANAMTIWLNIWDYGQGFDLIVKAWQERASHIGKVISLTSANQTVAGKFLQLGPDGALVLELEDGRQKHFHAGDVSFRSPDVQ